MSPDHVLHLTLPLPPSQNHAYRRHTNMSGRRMNVLTSKASRWMADAKDIGVIEMRRTGWTCPMDEKVVVEITVYWPDRRRRDVQNLFKLLCDALEGVAVNDDKWMLVRVMDFTTDKADPRLVVRVRRP